MFCWKSNHVLVFLSNWKEICVKENPIALNKWRRRKKEEETKMKYISRKSEWFSFYYRCWVFWLVLYFCSALNFQQIIMALFSFRKWNSQMKLRDHSNLQCFRILAADDLVSITLIITETIYMNNALCVEYLTSMIQFNENIILLTNV